VGCVQSAQTPLDTTGFVFVNAVLSPLSEKKAVFYL
jgi:hypothetical protein